jgi:beta-1,2-mannobiose phosphorylase / 1,2-beta-oligomannan phosphorylase
MDQSNMNTSGWRKWPGGPVLGGTLGTCFDMAVLHDNGRYRMWFSWRPQQSIALTESDDGIQWSTPTIVLRPRPDLGWEDEVNRPVVLERDDGYHMWYTGQTWSSNREGQSCIGYAVSHDGFTWTRVQKQPVLVSTDDWEGVAVMCPHVLWDAQAQRFSMWYSAGEQYEPDAIGFATSRDGCVWDKNRTNPIFRADPSHSWERQKVTACQVVPYHDGYLMFYIGFADIDHAQIGVAWSANGITHWQRLPTNPIIAPGAAADAWDHDAVYKPYAIFDSKRWLLWYNGRLGAVEQIGLAMHDGEDLGF